MRKKQFVSILRHGWRAESFIITKAKRNLHEIQIPFYVAEFGNQRLMTSAGLVKELITAVASLK